MRIKFLLSFLFCITLAACQKPASEDSGAPSGGGDNTTRTGEATTDCGVVTNGRLSNPVNLEDGRVVKVTQVISNNLLVVQDNNGGGTELIKLQGVASSSSSSGRQMIQGLTSPDATYFKASNDCNVTLEGGGTGTIGHLISRNGKSVGESLIRSGFASADTNDACGGNLIGTCLNALRETPNTPENPVEPVGEMEMFLWKPLSDTQGPIAVAMERHCNASIRVNGESFTGRGDGNGRCTSSLGRKSGCSYGKNVRVEVIDNASGRPYTHNGQPFVIVPDGCQRFGF